LEAERCANPWNPRCKSTDIKLYIQYNGKILPICSACWSKIVKRGIEWENKNS